MGVCSKRVESLFLRKCIGYPIRQTGGHRGEDTVVERWPVKKV